jgi:hypothetical protein
MRNRWQLPLAAMALLFASWPQAFAQASADAQTEINYLLNFVEISGCEFYRNGSWYTSEQAQEHLRTKFEYLLARNRIHTAEDFIQLAATKSSMSGKPYQIRCGECAPGAASNWLTGVLLRFRSVQARSTRP